jgi:alkylation response protein AidB-like acyl-CoA dehydrogenase
MAATKPGDGLSSLRLRSVQLPQQAKDTRSEVRAFLLDQLAEGLFAPRVDAWLRGFSPEFSAKLGGRGWIGMTWPAEYGGRERSALERFVVLEELLIAGAPVAAHWIADRQSGPQILRHGTDEARRTILPAIARGECFVSLGMSEPGSGSDLASVRTTATPVEGGWRVDGSKIWTSHAHRSHYITALCRTDVSCPKHQGLSTLIVDLGAPGVDVRPVRLIDGESHFNEVFFTDVFVPRAMLVGAENDGWGLVTSELSLERSGPERILSTYPLLAALVERAPDYAATSVGELVAELWVLRRLSLSIAAAIDDGDDPVAEAAMVKDLGTAFEQRVIDVARQVTGDEPSPHDPDPFRAMLAESILAAPGFTLRGGTTEILRTVVARTLVDTR